MLRDWYIGEWEIPHDICGITTIEREIVFFVDREIFFWDFDITFVDVGIDWHVYWWIDHSIWRHHLRRYGIATTSETHTTTSTTLRSGIILICESDSTKWFWFCCLNILFEGKGRSRRLGKYAWAESDSEDETETESTNHWPPLEPERWFSHRCEFVHDFFP